MVIVCFSCPLVFQEYLLLYSNSCSDRKSHENGILLLGVLYAPVLQDDFYLNFVDWSSHNVLSAGSGNCVYPWNAATRSPSSTIWGRATLFISWAQCGTHLSVGSNYGPGKVKTNSLLRGIPHGRCNTGSICTEPAE
ncbi:protein FIZZY-RELATED 1 isoform X1 [Triticum aestivum]|uniref:protein FIZZY-RELATED 1 isoform X1 n=1 Tax=Triticum aestivum TaxID=4565 RepID=UPI001D0341E7|nr:protein FIZZY-RELATED 1-like isoform X1 [Triticum aestivum]